MKKLTILIDHDDVLVDLVGAWVNELNRLYGTNVAFEDITDWHMAQFFPGISDQQLYAPLSRSDFWKKVNPIPGAQVNVRRLLEDGHNIKVVTASHYRTIVPKIGRFLFLFPFLSWKDVIIASDKSLITGDVLIDDGVHNLQQTNCLKFLFDRPHNHTYDTAPNGMVRAGSWDDIYRSIAAIVS